MAIGYYSALVELWFYLVLILHLKVEQECWCMMKFEGTEFKFRTRLARGRL